MKKLLFSALLAIVATFCFFDQPARAQSAKTLLEQRVFYQFDPARADPKSVDNRLWEADFRGLVLWVSKPKPGKPTIFYLPGSGGNLGLRRNKFPWFLDRGYGLVAMAYPGMNGSKGVPSRQHIQNLANQLYKQMPALVGNGPTIIWGESLGTGIALEIATHAVGRNRPPLGIILQAPYTSLVDLVASKKPAMLPLFLGRTDLWPSKRTIKHSTVPLLIMHGGKDRKVPVSMGKKLYRLSPSPNKKLITYPDAGHTTIWRKDALATMHEWVEALY
ncbi:alpha/beta hydrolase [Aliiroseovarius sp. 2305UL8-7]|uniref:alpha/beta hydrolase n=1 Tax=Aliiroseovarius conchicola TaxID=3121637 RepID=UPI0035283D8B